jgi:flagellin-specific chaperone FliS
MKLHLMRELLESVDVLNPERACERISEALQELRQVEADRAKDAELIQMLVDGLHNVATLADVDTDERSTIARNPLAAAEAAGFKPSEP